MYSTSKQVEWDDGSSVPCFKEEVMYENITEQKAMARRELMWGAVSSETPRST